jgi:hypothetical protein
MHLQLRISHVVEAEAEAEADQVVTRYHTCESESIYLRSMNVRFTASNEMHIIEVYH